MKYWFSLSHLLFLIISRVNFIHHINYVHHITYIHHINYVHHIIYIHSINYVNHINFVSLVLTQLDFLQSKWNISSWIANWMNYNFVSNFELLDLWITLIQTSSPYPIPFKQNQSCIYIMWTILQGQHPLTRQSRGEKLCKIRSRVVTSNLPSLLLFVSKAMTTRLIQVVSSDTRSES